MLLCTSFNFARHSLIDRRLLVDRALCAKEEYFLEEFWLWPPLDGSVGGGLCVLLFVVVMCVWLLE